MTVRVMVVDDHPMWRDGVARDLTDAGYLVTAAISAGAQALRVAAAARPDVVVLDLQLPDLSGVEVIGGLLDALPAVRILMLSASGEQRDVLDALKAGQVAEDLTVSVRTVQNHVQNTLGKLQLHNRSALVRYAFENGLD